MVWFWYHANINAQTEGLSCRFSWQLLGGKVRKLVKYTFCWLCKTSLAPHHLIPSASSHGAFNKMQPSFISDKGMRYCINILNSVNKYISIYSVLLKIDHARAQYPKYHAGDRKLRRYWDLSSPEEASATQPAVQLTLENASLLALPDWPRERIVKEHATPTSFKWIVYVLC